MANLDIVRRRTAPVPPAPKASTPKLEISPSKPATKIRMPSLSLPKLPKFRFPKIALPKLPWKIIVSAAVLLAMLAAWVFFSLPTATVTVFARSEPVARDFELRVDPSINAASSEQLSIPGKIIEREQNGNKIVPATGTKNIGKSASGFISIYNFSKTTLILKAQTTSVTVSGKKYFFTQDVGGIRPTAFIGLEDQEVDESSLIPPVPIAALAPGEEYNLPVGTRVEIANEAFGSQPKVLYGVVAEGGVTGGTTQLVKLVSAGDVENGLGSLTTDLVAKVKADFAAQNPNVRISDNALETEITEKFSEKQPGAEATEFSVAAKVKLRALTYDERDLKQVVFERVKRLLPETKKLSEENMVLDSRLTGVKLSEGQAMLQAHFEGEIKYELNSADLLEKVRGKTAEEIREIFLSKPEIASLKVDFFPFWVKSAPRLRDRITLDVR